jgi:superfamily I DNA and/or RNA helicase
MEFADATSLSTELEAEAVALRDKLIDKLMPDYRPPMIRHRLDSGGLHLLGQLEDAIGDKLKHSRLGVASVLSRYSDSFVNHPERARMTVREYAMIVGATCQQSAGKDMASLKELSGISDAGIAFDTVIIDEAARANPLDLFIPMSMANKRIVLVGDHRQLPHLLEPLIEDEVSRQHNLSIAQKDAYKESLFERLWRQLKDQGRVVMLNTQFRMHPIMGAFVSRYFYEDAGLDKLEHGRDPEDFLNKVPGFEGKVCAWLNLPIHHGKEDRRGNSRVRIAEALKVAEEVKRLLDACDANISIGVITFYSAQRDAIFSALSSHAVTERNDDTGEWQISSQYRDTPNREERLRIGTVDAFQGKEFDIVFLSIVRSNEKNIPTNVTDSEIFEKFANSKYGHLRLDNRLNVAMSRQRSLLIAIGDSAMFSGEQEVKTAPVLAAFYQLCNGEYGLVR